MIEELLRRLSELAERATLSLLFPGGDVLVFGIAAAIQSNSSLPSGWYMYFFSYVVVTLYM